MAPKRKRPERQASEDSGAKRPSPYRPERGAAKETSEVESKNAAPASSISAAPATPANDASLATMAAPKYPFDHVTDELVSSWSDGGSSTVAAAAVQADEMLLSEILQELTESCLHGRLSGQQAGAVIREIIDARREADGLDVTSQFLDVISLLDDDYQKVPALRSLVAATSIDPTIFRQELDIPLLQALSLVRETFEKMRTRKSTNILYKQANFNLLREESEGYAKLVTDYFNTVQDACSRRDENPNIAEDAFQRVKALVGAFDLDVGRVLDITLDVSANLLVKAYPFLMKFYRASSWWPGNDVHDHIKFEDQGFSTLPAWALPGSGRSTGSEEEDAALFALRETRDVRFWDSVSKKGMDAFFEIGGRRITNYDAVLPILEAEIPTEVDSRGKQTNPEKRQYLVEQRKYMRETRNLPPSGNYDAAQLLGFKLRFYASPARNASDILPDNLIKLAAFLIKIGFISLRDLYPHLHPADADMPQEKSRLEKEKAAREAKEKPGAGSNALAMAGALTDDTLAAPRPTRSDKERSGGATPAQDKKEEPAEELPTPENQKIQLLKALLLIGALPEALHIIGRFPWLVEVDITIPPLLHRIANHMLSKMCADSRPLANLVGLRQPREQVADTVPQADGRLAFSTRQLSRSMRWLKSDAHNPDDGVAYIHYYVDWNDNIPVCQSLGDVFLLCNTFLGLLGLKVGQDVKLYGTLLRLAKANLQQDTSNENLTKWLELMKRLLVPALSLSKHNPQLAQDVFDLLSFYPTSTRYNIYAEWFTGRTSRLPDMRSAFDRNKAEVRDVLRRVSNDSGKKQSRALAKVALASPGIVVMEMINQLESYSNMIPSLVECTRFFSPLAYDVLTWCLINSMGGQGRDRQQADGMLTSPWLQALSHFVASLFTKYSNLDPTPVLQYLAFELRSGNATDLEMIEQILVEMAGIRSDVEFNDAQVLAMAGGEQLQGHIMRQLSDARHTKDKSAKRLIKALSEPKLVGQILVAIAQERQMYPDHENSSYMPLKVLGSNLDKISAIFAQYLEVLRANLKPDQFELSVPDSASLVGDFGIEPGIALTICRTVVRFRMSEFDVARKQEVLEEKKLKAAQAKAESNGDTSMQDTETPAEEQKEDAAAINKSPWHPVLQPIIDKFAIVSPALSIRVSLPFYVTFWTLMHQDLLVPTDSYKKEISRIDSLINEISGNRSDMSAVALKERDRKKKALLDTRDKLSNETKPHLNAYMQVRSRISNGENHHWFPKIEAKDTKQEHAAKDARHLGLLEECFLPRAMLSSLDAHYSFQMLKIMHDNGTPGFSLMHLLSQLFKKQQLACIMFQCTAVEAQNFGRFICETMKLLHRWHADKATYEKEALGLKKKLPGFVKTFDEKGEPKNIMDWEEFRRLLFNFHTFLYGALTACFESDEYMHVRNAIIVLKSVHVVFPTLAFQGKNMIDVVKKFSEKDSRSDLKLAAMSLLGPLKSGEKNWLTPQKFRLNDPGKDGAKAGSRNSSAKPETPQPSTKLNASASEFKPDSASKGSGASRKESLAGGREDGEIEDDKGTNRDGDTEMRDATKIASHANAVIKEDARAATKTTVRIVDDVKNVRDSANDSRAGTPTAPGSTRAAQRNSGRSESSSAAPATQAIPARPPPYIPPPRGERDLPAKLPPQFSRNRDEGYGRLDRPSEMRTESRDPSPFGRNGRTRSPSHVGTRGSLREDRSYDSRPSADGRAHDDVRRRETTGDARSQTNLRERPADLPAAPERPNRIASSVILPPDTQLPSRPTSASSGLPTPSADTQQYVNPARLAMITSDTANGVSPRRGRDTPHSDLDQRREREPRLDERVAQADLPGRPDTRTNGRAHGDARDQARMDPFTDQAPTGPKRVRSTRDFNANAESTYGRLNTPQSQEPSAPNPRASNGPAGRGGRTFTPNSRGGERPPSPGRQADFAAPSRGALPRQPSHTHFDHASAANSTPSTPAGDNMPAVHPSRMAQLSQPPALQTNFAAPNGPRSDVSPGGAVPSGPRATPRGPGSTPIGPSPTTGVPPSGPARRNERPSRQSMNNSANNSPLPAPGAAPGGQGVNFRGASARQANTTSFSPAGQRNATGGPSPAVDHRGRQMHTDRQGFDDSPAGQNRPDLFQGKSDWQDNAGPNDQSRRRPDDDRSRGRPPHEESSSFRQGGNIPQIPPQGGADDSRDRRGPRQSRDGSPRGRRGPNGPPDSGPRRPDLTGPPPPVPEWERNAGPMRGQDDGRRNSGRGPGPNLDGPGPRGPDFRNNNNFGVSGPPMHMGNGGQMRRDDERGPRGPRDDMPPVMQQQQQQQQSSQNDHRKRGPPIPPYESSGSAKRRRN